MTSDYQAIAADTGRPFVFPSPEYPDHQELFRAIAWIEKRWPGRTAQRTSPYHIQLFTDKGIGHVWLLNKGTLKWRLPPLTRGKRYETIVGMAESLFATLGNYKPTEPPDPASPKPVHQPDGHVPDRPTGRRVSTMPSLDYLPQSPPRLPPRSLFADAGPITGGTSSGGFRLPDLSSVDTSVLTPPERLWPSLAQSVFDGTLPSDHEGPPKRYMSLISLIGKVETMDDAFLSGLVKAIYDVAKKVGYSSPESQRAAICDKLNDMTHVLSGVRRSVLQCVLRPPT